MKEELLKGLSEEQIAKIKACKNQEEILAIAKEEGIELTDEQLQAVSGGCGTRTCSNCGSHDIEAVPYNNSITDWGFRNTCRSCGYVWLD